MVVAVCNLFLKLKVVSPDQSVSGRLVFGSSGEAILELKSATSSSGNTRYRGEYASSGVTEFGSGTFAFGDIVRVNSDNAEYISSDAELGVWICIFDGATDFPTSAETQWHLISGVGGSSSDCPYV